MQPCAYGEHFTRRGAARGRGRRGYDGSGWSLQKEIIERLFGDGLVTADSVGDSNLGADGPSLGGEPTAQGDTVSRAAPAAAKPCSRKARHHINHGGNPCPECGWPTKVVT